MAKAADLGSLSVRPGQARGAQPEIVAGGPPLEPAHHEAHAPALTVVPALPVADGAGQGGTTSVPVLVDHKPVVAMPRREPKPRMIQLGVRVPEELAKAVRWKARIEEMDLQTLFGFVLEAGLQAQFGPDWREQLDAQVPTWRMLNL